MNTNRAVPLIAVLEGYGVEDALKGIGAETFDVSNKAEAKLALTYADAIIFTGGGDIDPQRYGQKPHTSVYGVDHDRDKLEFWLVKKAKERGIPLMGICRGSQLLNVAHGGTLNQNLDGDNDENHWGVEMWVKLARKSKLYNALNSGVLRSSHYHHQAVGQVGEGLAAIAWAGDGTIEAIESRHDNPHYVLGLQFHPEMDYRTDEDALAIFTHFAWNIASKFSARRKDSALVRCGKVEGHRPPRRSLFDGRYDYSKGSRVYDAAHAAENVLGWTTWDDEKDGLEGFYDAYTYGDRDDWDHQEWLRLNSAGLDHAEVDAGCVMPPCTNPRDCMTWGDCATVAVQRRSNLATEHVHYLDGSPELDAEGETQAASIIAAQKRGNPGRDRL